MRDFIYPSWTCCRRPMIAIGAIAERGRLGPALVFVFIWATIVYDPIACWTWNKNGWSNILGVLDFAGGTPVHISSGTAALAISKYLRPRKNFVTPSFGFRAHNATYVILGTVFMWFGWFGFNGGAFYIVVVCGRVLTFARSRICVISKPTGRTGLHCHKFGCRCWRSHLDVVGKSQNAFRLCVDQLSMLSTGLQMPGGKMVGCFLLLRSYFWSCCYYSRIRFCWCS